jgi:hypothetical protein
MPPRGFSRGLCLICTAGLVRHYRPSGDPAQRRSASTFTRRRVPTCTDGTEPSRITRAMRAVDSPTSRAARAIGTSSPIGEPAPLARFEAVERGVTTQIFSPEFVVSHREGFRKCSLELVCFTWISVSISTFLFAISLSSDPSVTFRPRPLPIETNRLTSINCRMRLGPTESRSHATRTETADSPTVGAIASTSSALVIRLERLPAAIGPAFSLRRRLRRSLRIQDYLTHGFASPDATQSALRRK